MLKNLTNERNIIGQFQNFLPVLDSCVLPPPAGACEDEKLLICNYEKDNGSLKMFCKGIKYVDQVTFDLSETADSLRSVDNIFAFEDFDKRLCIVLAGRECTSAFSTDGNRVKALSLSLSFSI